MATRSTAARLRRTFHYPTDTTTASGSDSDSDSPPSAMDEQEQESYIQRLADNNKAQNATLASILLLVPILATIPYLPSLPSLPALLALSSLLSTAYLLRRLPPTVTGLHPIDACCTGTGGAAGLARSPLDQNLPYLNALLAALLAFWGAAVAYKARNFDGGVGEGVMPGKSAGGALAWPIMCTLPAGVYGVVLLAKIVMAGVDPEKELSALRYDYKGA
ncbi:hypothetical protein LEL_05776 [Akanthomyces lecanii RCEF 1005]|uniref:Uncharacterized protein n=1 Tax=Akanthomyces lecanii RCEF 1005 TaxID=1081108 RepID=A0A162K081_CORDF|nr:hypothetical protein LEL_05776 [Akanthomyces lecanii RCEF 1005]